MLLAKRYTGRGILFPALIVGPLLAGAIVALCHHAYFHWLNGRSPYIWISGAMGSSDVLWWLTTSTKAESVIGNGFVLGAKALFALSITSSLTQILWRTARARQLTIAQLDLLFSLPSFGALPRLCFSHLAGPLFPVLVVALVIYLISLMTVFIPSSMVPVNSVPFNGSLQVPMVDVYAPPGLDAEVLTHPGKTQPSLILWPDYMRAMTTFFAPIWYPPDGCEQGCNYTFRYIAPALKCSNLTADQISDGSDSNPNSFPAQLFNWRTDAFGPNTSAHNFPFVYNGTSNLPSDGEDIVPPDPWNFVVAIKPDGNAPSVTGASCTFFNATYEASTQFGDFGQTTNVSAVEYGDPLSDPWANSTQCPWTGNSNNNPATTVYSPCMTFGVNTRIMALGFVNMMRGTLAFADGQHNTTAVSSPIFSVDGLNDFFNITDLLGDDLPSSLEKLMAQSTLATLYRTDNNVTIDDAQILIGVSEWQYDPLHLVLAYSIAIAMTTACAVYGLVALYRNHSPGSFAFSHFLAATRSHGLSNMALHDDMHFLPSDVKEATVQYGKVYMNGRWIHSFGVVGKDEIVSLYEDTSDREGRQISGRRWLRGLSLVDKDETELLTGKDSHEWGAEAV